MGIYTDYCKLSVSLDLCSGDVDRCFINYFREAMVYGCCRGGWVYGRGVIARTTLLLGI